MSDAYKKIIDYISNISAHDIFNDTNKKWLRLYNEYNQITFNLKCQVTIKYREYRRMVIY